MPIYLSIQACMHVCVFSIGDCPDGPDTVLPGGMKELYM